VSVTKRPKIAVYTGDVGGGLLTCIKQKPDVIYLSSEGGCLYTMCACIDALQEHDCCVIATGQCFSAAVPILAVAAKRLATPRTRFMVHPSSAEMTGIHGKGEIDAERDELDWLEQEYLNILSKCTNHRKNWWRKRIAATTYFGSEEARRHGVIDQVVYPHVPTM